MTFSPLHASLLTLALFTAAGPAHAAQPGAEPAILLAQAETSPDLDQIRKFLASGRDLSKLDDERLANRLTRAKRLQRTEGLPPDIAQELEQEVAAITAEIERRQQAAAAPAPEPAPQPEAQPEAQPQEQAQAEPQPEPAPAPQPEAQAQPEPQIEQPPLPETSPDIQTETQAQAQPEPQPAPAPEAAPPAAEGSAEVAAFLQSVRPAAELDEAALRQQMRQATELAQQEGISAEQRKALRDVIREARAALRSDNQQQEAAPAQPEPQPAAPQPETQAQQPAPEQPAAPAEQVKVDPEAERQAKAFLTDNVDVSTLERRELRERLTRIRDLLATNQLSPETREALRKKLAAERQVLRAEVRASEKGEAPAQQATGGGTTNNNTTANTNVTVNNTTTITNNDVRIALNDQRPPRELEEDELVRRIDVYRDVVRDDRYSEAERRAWRRALERDRRYLREQMLEERRAREARLRAGDFELSINIEDDYEPNRDVPEDVFAAEVEDEEIADVLAAPPRRKVERRYTVEEIERTPAARNAVARIEIDTVHFGFGEGFLREEEIDKLDRIAQVLERILAKNPDEIFLLEGHTDAVGSDAANLKLSRERAKAVKDALTTYYVIPARNLQTAGLGERYLKIPTNQPEAENRRVSLARITPLVGELD